MGTTKYVSDVHLIDRNVELVYNHLSDFQNLSRVLTDELIEKVSGSLPGVSIDNFESDSDSCRFDVSGMGRTEIRVVDRDPHKTIKVQGGGDLPIDLTFWIQLLPMAPYSTKLRLTLQTEMSMMVKMVVGNKLEEGVNRLALVLAGLPYS